jgi:hypothetical protein
MGYHDGKEESALLCSQFEDQLSDYIDGGLGSVLQKAMAAHALRCPLCHGLLSDVKGNLQVCHELNTPRVALTRLEANIIARTMPENEMACEEFEEQLTDYLDGFLPAHAFHRWERHAALCANCTDLPGVVVRSIGLCYTYKNDELLCPEGLHERILEATLGTAVARSVKPGFIEQVKEAMRGWLSPLAIPMPQMASVAMVFLLAVVVLSQSVSADASLRNVYQQSFELAEQTYRQGADTVGESFNNLGVKPPAANPQNSANPADPNAPEPTYVEDSK